MLHLSARFQNHDVMKLLLAARAKVEGRDSNGSAWARGSRLPGYSLQMSHVRKMRPDSGMSTGPIDPLISSESTRKFDSN